MLDNAREHIFDGIVVRTAQGERLVDAPEVARTAQRAVTLTITAEQAADLQPPESGDAPGAKRPGGGLLSRLLGGGRRG